VQTSCYLPKYPVLDPEGVALHDCNLPFPLSFSGGKADPYHIFFFFLFSFFTSKFFQLQLSPGISWNSVEIAVVMTFA